MSDANENGLGPMSLWDKMFVSKKLFLLSNVVAIICFLFDAYKLIRYSTVTAVFSLVSLAVLIIALIGMRYCSRTYNDNAVKSIIGILLGVIFTYDLRFFDRNITLYTTETIIISSIKLALDIALIVFYILARDSEKSNYKLILLVRVAFIAVSVFTALNNIPFYLDDWGTHWFLQDIVETLAFICTLFSVVCATSTVDRYKMVREYYIGIGKWTEERRQETKKEFFGK